MALARGDLARHVEDYIRRGNNAAAAEKLDEWAHTFPADKLDGYWSLLRTRQLIAAGQHVRAAREAEVLVGVSPKSHHAPALLMLAAGAHRKAGQADKAAAALKRIISDYSESSLAARAAAMLESK